MWKKRPLLNLMWLKIPLFNERTNLLAEDTVLSKPRWKFTMCQPYATNNTFLSANRGKRIFIWSLHKPIRLLFRIHFSTFRILESWSSKRLLVVRASRRMETRGPRTKATERGDVREKEKKENRGGGGKIWLVEGPRGMGWTIRH